MSDELEAARPLLGVKALVVQGVLGLLPSSRELCLASSFVAGYPPIGTEWPRPPFPFVAECPYSLQAQPHGVPALGCSCGIYGSVGSVDVAADEVMVLVRAWGRLVLHTEGWRAERARIEAVVASRWRAPTPLNAGPRPLDLLAAEAYGVPLLREWAEAEELLRPTRAYIDACAFDLPGRGAAPGADGDRA